MVFSENIQLSAKTEAEIKACEIFAAEWNSRFHFLPQTTEEKSGVPTVSFIINKENDCEEFSVTETADGIEVCAHRLRGLLYGIGKILRNLSFCDNNIIVFDEAFGTFSPDMPVRGHGLCYTHMSNTYEAWDKEQFRRYIIELMYFGLNTVEASYSAGDERTELMKYTFSEAFNMISSLCDELDVDLTVWNSVTKKRSDEETIAEMLDTFGNAPKISSLFIPGGDPGDMLPEEFLARCIKIKEAFSARFPEIKLTPSAQAPHEYPDWGERFAKEMQKLPPEIDGIIYGPNHAMPLDDLRRTVDTRYPLHHYPDIAHNVRCETPVHFLRDDWHFAWTSTLSREAVNPRPLEYQLFHRRSRQYVDGQVSYSEGVNDDVNKVIWGSLDFDFYAEPKEILKEYARTYFFGTDEEMLATGILGLEQNWNCDPIDSTSVEPTYNLFCRLADETPSLCDNWRFGLLLFRATCDKIVRDRRIFELDLIKKATVAIKANRLKEAESILKTDFPQSYRMMRAGLFPQAEKLFRQIGIQLDVEHFKGMSWERGCTLMTIDMPITDRTFLLNKIQSGVDKDSLLKIINRGKVAKDEYYFSFAYHGFDVCGTQNGEFYMDFQGDRNGNAALPMAMVKNYDHFEFKTTVAGLTHGNYRLRITYKNRNHENIKHHKITVNSRLIFDGKDFGGTRDEAFEKLFIPDGYQSIIYEIPASYIENGCVTLAITEPTVGFIISEYWFEKSE